MIHVVIMTVLVLAVLFGILMLPSKGARLERADKLAQPSKGTP